MQLSLNSFMETSLAKNPHGYLCNKCDQAKAYFMHKEELQKIEQEVVATVSRLTRLATTSLQDMATNSMDTTSSNAAVSRQHTQLSRISSRSKRRRLMSTQDQSPLVQASVTPSSNSLPSAVVQSSMLPPSNSVPAALAQGSVLPPSSSVPSTLAQASMLPPSSSISSTLAQASVPLSSIPVPSTPPSSAQVNTGRRDISPAVTVSICSILIIIYATHF